MPAELYEVLARTARYGFTLLGVVIVLRAFWWLAQDRRERHRRVRQLPDTGMIGEMVVETGTEALTAGTAFPVPWEGVLGALRTCDICLPEGDVGSYHADFAFTEGVGLVITPRRGQRVAVDGVTLQSRAEAQANPMLHNSVLEVGGLRLRLRVFAGLEVETYVEEASDGQA